MEVVARPTLTPGDQTVNDTENIQPHSRGHHAELSSNYLRFATRGHDPNVFKVGSKLKQAVAPWFCFRVAAGDRKQLPHRCGFVQVRLVVFQTISTPTSRTNR